VNLLHLFTFPPNLGTYPPVVVVYNSFG
jgi:hypothetical protein